MTDIATWLGQQLDEVERIALGSYPGPWVADLDDALDENVTNETGQIVAWVRARPFTDATRVHIARHDPDSVLRDVAAKRRILARHWDGHGCPVCLIEMGADEDTDGNAHEYPVLHWTGPCETVRDLAEPYADRPGYKDEWRA